MRKLLCRSAWTLAGLGISCLPWLRAEQPVPPRAIALSAPEVLKLDWNTRALSSADLDGDGANDLVLVNNDRASIDLLYQVRPGEVLPAPVRRMAANRWEPVLEDARFRKVRVTTGSTLFDLIAVDLNGDGRLDLAYTGDPQALAIRYQQEDGSWGERKVADAPAPSPLVGCLRAADLNGDGRQDLVMLALKEIAVFHQEMSGELRLSERMALVDEGTFGLELVDVDGDGRPDIVTLSPANRDGLRVRLQVGPRQFGPEMAFPLKPARSTLQLIARAEGTSPVTFVYARDQTGHIATVSLERRAISGPAEFGDLRPQVFTPRVAPRLPASYAFGDFDGDGQEDLALGDPDAAQMILYRRQRTGGFAPAERFPSLADARSIASGDWDGDGRAELFIASPKEQAVGIASLAKNGRFDYPQPFPGTGKPLALAAGPLGGGKSTWVAVVRDEKGRRLIDLWTRLEAAPALIQSLEIPATRTDPRAIRMLDVNQDGRLDLVVFTPLESVRVWLQSPPGRAGTLLFKDVSSSPAFRKGLVDNLESGSLTAADVDGDGNEELLVSRQGFARALTVDAEGRLSVLDQYNARDPAADVQASFSIPGKPGEAPRIVLYDRKGERLEMLQADERKVYRVVETAPVGRIDVVQAEFRLRPGSDGGEIFLLGRDRFWWLPLQGDGLHLRDGLEHATDLPDVGYSDVIAGDLNADGELDLACVDPMHNIIEILSRDARGAWQSRLHFQVFEADGNVIGNKGGAAEPRETIIADVNRDGIKDLVLLVHDRVLIYPSKAP